MSHDMPPGCTVGSCIAFPRRDFSLLAEKERRLAGLMEGKMVVFVIDAAAPDDDDDDNFSRRASCLLMSTLATDTTRILTAGANSGLRSPLAPKSKLRERRRW